MKRWILLGVLPVTAAQAADELTVYELLAPDSHSFAIIYDVTATKEGADFFLNPIRKGSVATKERVLDRATGKELKWEVVSEKGADYIKVHLLAPVPKEGETRIRILKTYTDAKSYYAAGGKLVFDRPLGIRRNVVVLPAGWELTGSAAPAIVSTQADGRVRLSFYNDRDDQMPVKITARRLP